MSGVAAARAEGRFRIVRWGLGLMALVPPIMAVTDQQPTWLDRPLYDLLVRDILPMGKVDDSVVFIDIDDKSLEDLNQRWPIPRQMWARLVRQTAQFQPAAIALDAFFPERADKPDVELALETADRIRDDALDATPEGKALADDLDRQAQLRDADLQLTQAVAEAGNVVLGIADSGHTSGVGESGKVTGLPQILGVPKALVPSLAYASPRGNLPELTMAARSQAGLHVPYSEDGVMRRYGYVARADGQHVPSLALAAVQVAYPKRAGALGAASVAIDDGLPLLRWFDVNKVPRVRLSDILDAKPDDAALRAALKGRIVFVGVSAAGASDRRPTPLRSDLPGTYVHIVATHNLLHGDLVSSKSPYSFGLTALASLLALILYLSWRKMVSSSAVVLTAAGLMGIWCVVGFFGLDQGTWLPIAPVLLATVVPMGGELVLRATAAEESRQQIREAFQFYLSPAVVEELVNDPDKLRLGGSRREISAFFSDIAGFTTISEQLDPADLTALLNEYLGAMTEIVLEEGGTVDKYIGDAIVAMFGAPLDQPDHAVRACRAALRCSRRLDELRPTWVARGWPEVHARIGVNSGVALVGNMGSSKRFDYTMLGDTVNLAARLEGANKAYGTKLMIGPTTSELARDAIALRELDLVRVKGKLNGVAIFEPLGLRGEVSAEVDHRVRMFADGLRAYRALRWEDARACFEGAAQAGDPPAKVFLKRLETLVHDPPGPDWDGAYEMTEK